MGGMSTTEKVVHSIDPRTGEAVEAVAAETDLAQLDRIVAAAVKATGDLQRLDFDTRARLLEAMAHTLEQNRERLVELADRESALGATRLEGELGRTTNQLRLFASVLRDGAFAEVVIDHASESGPDLRRMLIGLGPVAVFGASNFPFAFSAAGGDTASALAAGCAVVVKVHGAHPALDAAVVALLRHAAEEFGVDSAVVAAVFGREAGSALVGDARVQAVGFTGSERAGRLLMDIASARPAPIPVYAEMGSLNPLVVAPGALASRGALAETIAESVLLGAGQFCTKPGLVFIPEGVAGDQLVSDLAARLSASASTHLLSVAIRDSFVAGASAIAASPETVQLVSPRTGSGSASTAALSEVAVKALLKDERLIEECFGPGALVVRYPDVASVVEAIHGLPASLTLSVFAEESEAADTESIVSAAQERVGRIILNGVSTGVSVNWAQQHGGPYPASSNAMFTSVGASAVRRFLRPVAYQAFPEHMLPRALRDANALGIPRRVDGVLEVG